MKTQIRIFKDSFNRTLWYIKTDNGKIVDISEEFLRGDPQSALAFEISPSLVKEKSETANNESSAGTAATDSILQFLKDLAGGAVILAIPLYVAGWTYLQNYYSAFGLRMTELGFSLYDVLIYSIPVLVYVWWAVLITVLLLIIIGPPRKEEHRNWRVVKTIIFVVIFMFLVVGASKQGALMGRDDAVRDLNEQTTTLPYVAVEVDPEKVKYNQAQYVEYSSMEYTLLLNKNGYYYLFAPLKQLDGQNAEEVKEIITKNFEISVIPASLVNQVIIQRGVVRHR